MENTTAAKQTFGIKYGIIAGVGTILYMLLFYFIDQRMMLGPWVYRSTLLIYVIMMFMAVFAARKSGDGLIDIKEAIRIAFQTFIVANVLFYVFYYLLFNMFDPELVTLQKEMMMEFQEEYKDLEMAEQLKDMTEADLAFTLGKAIFSFAKDAITGFIFSLLIAGIARNK